MLAILAESALRSLVLGGVVWVGLNLLRVRNPHVQMTSWVIVLVASLAMPLLMHWTTVTITVDALPVAAPVSRHLAPVATAPDSLLPETLPPASAAEPAGPVAARGDRHIAINWGVVATIVYLSVAALLLLRLAVGIGLTWRLARAARPMREGWARQPWAANADVRVSDVIGGPVTVGSTILLPPQCAEWDAPKRQAVLAHEGAHVANRDFYVLLLASLNRTVFWFSPFAWWQFARLAELAETISDARALEVLEDRLSYAEILLDFVQNGRRAPVPSGLQMARSCTVRARVERILSATALPPQVNWRKRLWTALLVAPVVAVSAGSIAYREQPAAVATVESPAIPPAVGEPQRVDFYVLGPKRVFAISRQGDDLFGQLTGQRKLRLSVMPDGTHVYTATTGQISFALKDDQLPPELALVQNGRVLPALRIAALPQSATGGVKTEGGRPDAHAGWYQLAPNRVLNVSQAGNRIVVQETGRPKIELLAAGGDAFSSAQDDRIIFLHDGEAGGARLLFSDAASGPRLASRVDATRAQAIEGAFARWIAEAPDRFRDQAPLPGSKDMILRGIADIQRGAPNYAVMRPQLAARIRGQAAEMNSMFNALGSVESIFFRGVGPGGYDIYGLKFANGFAEIRILIGADGKVDDVVFRPDGDDTPGRVAACGEEQSLRAHADTSPVKLLFYNDSGRLIQLYKLDQDGKRMLHGTVADDTSFPVMTTVDSPWIVADAAGQCQEIVLAGQRTRYYTVDPPGTVNRSRRPSASRTAPHTGSEDMLRRYIDSLGHGDPDYGRMTPEVAAQTHRDLALQQAILARLGAVRAVTFRGVTALGSDIYIVHFANGSAEWRIGLARDNTIGRIALGPQY